MHEAPIEGREQAGLPPLWHGPAPTRERWESERRPQLLDLFAANIYGRTPTGGYLDDVTVTSRRSDALGGRATRIEADLRLGGPAGSRTASMLIYAPAGAMPAPAFLGLNFQGNHAVTFEPDVRIPAAAAAVDAAHGRAPVPPGAEQRRWPLSMIIERGYAVITLWYEELEIDLPGHAGDGVRGLFHRDACRGEDDWGAIGGWAWSLSRALDALSDLPQIDHTRVIAVGHSRLGKTALWAAAQDQRFVGVVSNDSGCCGASLFRHQGIEDIEVITSARPHWFAPRLRGYRGADELLPVDQHQLLALQAPRLVHVGSASRDAGADPVGEYLSTLAAAPAFDLYGCPSPRSLADLGPALDRIADCDESILPPAGRSVGGRLSYHLRTGDHDVLAEDWAHVLAAADAQLERQ